MRDPGHTLTRSDLRRVQRAVRHVEAFSRETINPTPLPGVERPYSPETVCRPVEITDDPPGGSAELSVLYRGLIYYRDGEAWQQASVLVRPILDDIRLLKVGMTTMAVLVSEFAEEGEFQGQLVFAAAETPAGCGLKYEESEEFPTYTSLALDLEAIAGDGLEVDAGEEEDECPKLKVISTGVVETLGCGLSRAGGTLHVDLTEVAFDGLYFDSEICALGVNYGCGITITSDPEEGDQLVVDVDALAGDNTLSSLVVVPGGASCDSLGVDLEVATTTTETVVTNSALSVVAGKLRLTQTKVEFTNYFNAAGLLIDRTAGSPSDSYTDTDICPIVECCTAEELAVECTRSTSSAETGDVISFTSTPSGGKEPYTYDWDWDDGTTHGTTQNPTHAYIAAGTYTPILTVYDDCGNFVLCYPGTITVTLAPPECCGDVEGYTALVTSATDCTTAPTLAAGDYWGISAGAAGTYMWFKITVPADGIWSLGFENGDFDGETCFQAIDEVTIYYGACPGVTLFGGGGGTIVKCAQIPGWFSTTYWARVRTLTGGFCFKAAVRATDCPCGDVFPPDCP